MFDPEVYLDVSLFFTVLFNVMIYWIAPPAPFLLFFLSSVFHNWTEAFGAACILKCFPYSSLILVECGHFITTIQIISHECVEVRLSFSCMECDRLLLTKVPICITAHTGPFTSEKQNSSNRDMKHPFFFPFNYSISIGHFPVIRLPLTDLHFAFYDIVLKK